MLEVGINIAQHSIAQHSMTSVFENETIDNCLIAYQHHVDLRYRNCLAFSVRRSCFSGGEERPPTPPPAMLFSLISTSAFIKTCDTSVVLKLQCLKIQACSVLFQFQSSYLMDIFRSGPFRSLLHGSATKLEKATGLIN